MSGSNAPQTSQTGTFNLIDLYVLAVCPGTKAFIVKEPTFSEGITVRALEDRVVRWSGVDGTVKVMDGGDAGAMEATSAPSASKNKKRRNKKRKKSPPPTFLPDGSNGDSVPSPLPPNLNKYWHQRKRLLSNGWITPPQSSTLTINGKTRDVTFNLTDEIIAERWYSVSPEIISRSMAGYLVHSSPPHPIPATQLYVDPFAGVGQDTISLSKSLTSLPHQNPPSSHVILSCDLDISCLLTTSHNLALQNVPKETVVLVWCNSVDLSQTISAVMDYEITPGQTAKTKEGYDIVRFGAQPGSSSVNDFDALWSSLPILALRPGKGAVVRGVFLSPPWNNTGYYDRGGKGKFTLVKDVIVEDGKGAEVTGMDIINGWKDKVVEGGGVCTFVPNTWDPSELPPPSSSSNDRIEIYRHILNGKHKTSCVYILL